MPNPANVPVFSKGEIKMPKVLVTDDEDLVREVIMAQLEDAGFEVVGVASGEAALDYLKDHAKELAGTVSDGKMPGMSGERYLTAVGELYPWLARIMLSADPPKNAASFAHLVLEKPLRRGDPQDIQKAIAEFSAKLH